MKDFSKKWGAYVSERSWGSVREDYSPDGDAWKYFPHDLARSKAYRWGEDGLAGLCDDQQRLVFSLALWNGKDPILKERLFGLDSWEGNHGEDVKECYFYLDATPSHSYLSYLYKYPHGEFPYNRMVEENKRRSTLDREFELLDTGIFNESRYFDVFVTYAKADDEDICIRLDIYNRGPEVADIYILPQLLFRNTWSWDPTLGSVPNIRTGPTGKNFTTLLAEGSMYLYGDVPTKLLFTNNETNNERVWKVPNRTPYVKDAFHRYVIRKEACVHPEEGTKACFYYEKVSIPAGKSHSIRMRLSSEALKAPLDDVDRVIAQRKKDADDFYQSIRPKNATEEQEKIQRQALSGLLWSTQFYMYDVKTWLKGDNPQHPPPASRLEGRNHDWKHLQAMDLISMPEKWEYPWFAAWDLAFQTVALSLVDEEGAKQQLKMVMQMQYLHPNGQIPAYEWSFSDLNPPVQAWAAWTLYEKQEKKDREFLEVCFLKLIRNFGWWVNKIDRLGNNFFEGGFLGLDNISVIDRSKPLPNGDMIEQSDGTGWMGFFALMMMKIALKLAETDPAYQDPAANFLEHFLLIARAMESTPKRAAAMWDDKDGFFYDLVLYPDGRSVPLKIRSFVGLIPFFSIDFFDEGYFSRFPLFHKHFESFSTKYFSAFKKCITPLDAISDKKGYLFSLMNISQMKRVLERVWNPEEFLSEHGLRSLSKYHEKNPLIFEGSKVGYEPAESLEKIKGGNSNWRGPIWFPTNYLFLCALHRLQKGVGDTLKIKGQPLSVLIQSLSTRLISLFEVGISGNRPVHGDAQIFGQDPYWKDLILFYEHYHGDTGRGLGGSHQTGWSSLVANIIDELED
jgi:hypothetical protein